MFGSILNRMIFGELVRVFVLALIALTGLFLLGGLVAEATHRGLAPSCSGTPRRSSVRDAKQSFMPSGDQQGELSSIGVLVSCVNPEPSMCETQTSGLPALLRIIATRLPSGETVALEFRPANFANGRRSPEVRL